METNSMINTKNDLKNMQYDEQVTLIHKSEKILTGNRNLIINSNNTSDTPIDFNTRANTLLHNANTIILIHSGFKHMCLKNRYGALEEINRLPLCVLLELLVVQDITRPIGRKDIFTLYKKWKLQQ